jgi:hypothetical protein
MFAQGRNIFVARLLEKVFLIVSFARILQAVKDFLTLCTKHLQQHTEDIELIITDIYGGWVCWVKSCKPGYPAKGLASLDNCVEGKKAHYMQEAWGQGATGMPGNMEPQGMGKAGG